jgi:release factor glutamine methyltransferase
MSESDPAGPHAPLPDIIDVRDRLAAGRQTFLGIEMLCGEGALVPRPETEVLGRTALAKLEARDPGPRVIDMCCGAGNLACAIAVHAADARVWASDLTDGCVGWTRRNVEQLGLTNRVHVCQGDLFDGLVGQGLEGSVDVVVCNPPYISTGRLTGDRAELLENEPREAFDGGPYGLSIHQRVMAEAPRFLRPGGWLLMEFGLGQHRQVKILLDRTKQFESIELSTDAIGNPRVIAARVKIPPVVEVV